MAAPTGIEAEIYASPVKLSETRVKVRLDRLLASANFCDEFGGSVLDTDLWSFIHPPGGSIAVAGGKLSLSATDTNAYPVVWSQPGKTFPLDLTIGWTLEWTMEFPVITGYGVFCRVIDLAHDAAIVAIKCNTADGYTVEMPDGTNIESLGADTGSHSYELIYTPATNTTAASYELKRDSVSKNTMSATGRQAWSVVIGNGSIQTSVGNWTQMAIARVDVNLISVEQQSWPDWSDREQVGSEWWGRLPWVSSLSMGLHERNALDQCVITMPLAGYISGVGYRENWFADFDWTNREVIIEARHGDGRRWTTWKTGFHGLCDEPQVRRGPDGPRLEVTVRDKWRRRLQMSHIVRGYSDAGGGIDGVIMGKTWTEIIEDECDVAGVAAVNRNVLSSALKPRSWQVMGESVLDNIGQLIDHGVAVAYTNRSQANFGRLEVQDYDWGSDTPDFYVSPDDAVSLDWANTLLGLTAQAVVTVQHSEFGEFSDSYPRAPIPPTGAVIRLSSAIAQYASDINAVRLLPFLAWQRANRELDSVRVDLVGQDWFEVGLETRVLDRQILNVADEYYMVIGADYNWRPEDGWLASVYLANQHPERAIMRAAMGESLVMVYPTAMVQVANEALNLGEASQRRLSLRRIIAERVNLGEASHHLLGPP